MLRHGASGASVRKPDEPYRVQASSREVVRGSMRAPYTYFSKVSEGNFGWHFRPDSGLPKKLCKLFEVVFLDTVHRGGHPSLSEVFVQ